MNLQLSRQSGGIKLTELEAWQPTFPELCREFSTPKIDSDKLNAGYFLRCGGSKRGNETVDDTASLLILDGDSRHDFDGNVIAGAVNPREVHLVLNHLNFDHFIYTSHSNRGFYGEMPYWKYRVLIPITYTRHQLPALLDWIFARLHQNDVMLANVKENASWAQAWFAPCVPAERAHLFKTWWRVGGVAIDKTNTADLLEPVEPFDIGRICDEYAAKSLVNEATPAIPAMARLPASSTNPITEFNAIFATHDVLIRNGYKQQGKRYLHPNSASKIAGVRILGSTKQKEPKSHAIFPEALIPVA